MSYHTRCDWCGEVIAPDDDRAVMPVTITHPGGRSTLRAKWAEETRPTLHFCASPVEDTDDDGRDRAGLIPEERFDSCFDRAVALITGTRLRDPGFGMEWRLVPVEDAPAPEPVQRPAVLAQDGWEAAHATWRRIAPGARESLLLHVLGDDRLVIREIAGRLNSQLGFPPEAGRIRAVTEAEAGQLVRRLFKAAKLERECETFKNKPRYRYFRPAADADVGDPEQSRDSRAVA